MSLILFLTGSVALVLRLSRERMERMETQLRLEESGTIAMSMLVRDLAESRQSSVLSVDDQLLVFPVPRDLAGQFLVEPDGRLRWSILVGYRKYEPEGRSYLIRQVADIDDSVEGPPEPQTMSPIPDPAYWETQGSRTRKVAEGFQSLKFSNDGKKSILELYLSLENHNRQYGLHLKSGVYPRN